MYKEQVARLFDQWDQILPNWHLYMAALCFSIAAVLYVKLVRVKKVPAKQAERTAEEAGE